LNELAVKYFTTQMVKESKILTNEKEIQQLKIGRARTVRYFIVAMSSLVLIIILVILSRFRVRKRSALALEKKNKDLEDVVGKLKMSGILLKKLNADKEALFHMITRDLRQPIRDLLARSEQLAKDYGNIPETGFQEKLDDLRNYSVLIYSIFDNLVNISALQAGKSAPEKGKHNLINILFDSIHNATENLSAQFSFNTLDFKDISLYTDFDLAVKAFNKLFQSLRGAMPDIQYTLSVKRKSSAVHLAFETENAVDFSVYFNKTSLDNLKSATGYEKPYTTDAGMLLLKKLKLDAYYAMECFRLLDIVPCIEKNEGKETMVLKIKQ
ncbi:MAG: HAMP domain-containing histidine kinase, partial [Bacteroidales bacterium]|nr:HAMP domain-containing histidine kinase [Bacteroidales bacterium]